MEDIIPLKAFLPNMRTKIIDQNMNNEIIRIELDLAEERREQVMIKLESCQQQLKK